MTMHAIKRSRHRHRPLVIGLTGSIGMGKSAVADMLRAEGVPVFDADQVVHRLQGPGGDLIEPIEAAFAGTTGPQGVERTKLGAAVFGDPAALKRLESIVHPAVARERERFTRLHRSRRMVVYDIPLLFERTGASSVDVIIVVSAAPWQQRRRVLARSGMTMPKFRQILALQMADHAKRLRADFVIHTGQSFDRTRTQVRKLVGQLRHALA